MSCLSLFSLGMQGWGCYPSIWPVFRFWTCVRLPSLTPVCWLSAVSEHTQNVVLLHRAEWEWAILRGAIVTTTTNVLSVARVLKCVCMCVNGEWLIGTVCLFSSHEKSVQSEYEQHQAHRWHVWGPQGNTARTTTARTVADANASFAQHWFENRNMKLHLWFGFTSTKWCHVVFICSLHICLLSDDLRALASEEPGTQ